MNATPLVALVGNPNAGKSALFNALTGARQKLGNYPGVTVERKSGRMALATGRPADLVDEEVVHQREKPGAQVGARVPQAPLVAGALQRVLHQVVGARGVARQQPRIPAQGRDVGEQLVEGHGANTWATVAGRDFRA